MPRLLDSIVKYELLWQLKQKRSINRISKALGIGKSTIYYHYKKLNGRKYILPQFTPAATEIEGEICGIFAGDGSQYFEQKKHHYQINVHFGLANKAYAEYVQKLFQAFFNKKFRLQKEHHAFRLRTDSKAIFEYFHLYLNYISQHKHDTVELKTLNLPVSFKQGFLRGLIDTDGSVIKDKTGRTVIVYYTTSEQLAQQVQKMLVEMGIICSIQIRKDPKYKTIYRTYVWKRSNDTFLNAIRPFWT